MNDRVGPILVSLLSSLAFILVLALLIVHPAELSPNAFTVVNVMVGALAAGYIQTLNFWFGSSAGSKKKDDTINNMAQTVVNASPPVSTKE